MGGRERTSFFGLDRLSDTSNASSHRLCQDDAFKCSGNTINIQINIPISIQRFAQSPALTSDSDRQTESLSPHSQVLVAVPLVPQCLQAAGSGSGTQWQVGSGPGRQAEPGQVLSESRWPVFVCCQPWTEDERVTPAGTDG